MSFSYNPASPGPTDFVRLLIPDTDSANPIFSDQEIEMFFTLQQNQFQTGMFWSGSAGRNLPSSPVSYLRVAAMAIGVIASDRARLANAVKLLDVSVDQKTLAGELRNTAKQYREVDDDAGAFAILEQVRNVFTFRDRWWSCVQRQSGQ